MIFGLEVVRGHQMSSFWTLIYANVEMKFYLCMVTLLYLKCTLFGVHEVHTWYVPDYEVHISIRIPLYWLLHHQLLSVDRLLDHPFFCLLLSVKYWPKWKYWYCWPICWFKYIGICKIGRIYLYRYRLDFNYEYISHQQL